MSLLSQAIHEAIQGSGGGGGGGSSRTPYEAPDSLHSKALLRILDIVSEGEIVGFADQANPLKCVYYNDTPVQNADGTLNFHNVIVESRTGTQTQDPIPGFDGVESEFGVNLEVKDDVPWIRQFTNTELTAIRLRMAVQALTKADTSTGNINGYSIGYAVDLSVDEGAFAEILTGTIRGKTTTTYERGLRIDLPPASTGWTIRLRRTTPNANSGTISDRLNLAAYTEVIDGLFRYPMTALIGNTIDSEEFSSPPSRAYRLKGRIIQVPSNYDPVTRVYTGVWDGTFKSAYSNNPAWVLYDYITHDRYGLGHRVPPNLADKWSLYTIGKYCDELVDDGFGGVEPRFTCNNFAQTAEDATRFLMNLVSVFNGVIYTAQASIFASADMPSDIKYIYNQTNVTDGKFEYSGSSMKTRHTVALVSWNDMNDMCRAKIEYVEDLEGIARYGVQKTEVIAVGSTSRGQAHRKGKMILATERYENNVCKWSVGLDGTVIEPGKLVKLADPKKGGRRFGGRVRSATLSTIEVDRIPVVEAGDSISVVLPDSSVESRTVYSITGDTITVASPFSQIPTAHAVWIVESGSLAAQIFRVLAVTESDEGNGYDMYGISHVPGKYDYVENGVALEQPPISANLPIKLTSPSNIAVTQRDVVYQNTTQKAATISWDAVSGASEYLLKWRQNDGSWSDVKGLYSTSHDLIGLLAGDLEIQIIALNAKGASLAAMFGPITIEAIGTPPKYVPDLQQADQQNADAIAQEILDRGAAITQEALDRAAAVQQAAEDAAADATAKANAAKADAQAYADTIVGTEAATRASETAANAQAIADEAATRASETAANAQAITDEATTRASEDARVTSEAAADATSKVNAAKTALQTNIDNVSSDLSTESQARIDGDAATAQAAADDLAAEVAARGTAISTEQQERVNADNALASQITTLGATVDDNTAAIQQEATTRASEDSALANSQEMLAVQMRGNYTGSDLSAVTSGLLFQERDARVSQDEAIAQQLTLLSVGVGEQFDYAKIWYFASSIESWSGNGTPTRNGSWLRPANHATDAYVQSPTSLNVNATEYPQVRLRIRKVGNPTWDGKLYWINASGEAWGTTKRLQLDEPEYGSDGIGVVLATVPWTGTIYRIRLDLGVAQTATDYFEIDWVAVGRPAPGASSAALSAEQSARAAADSAEVTSRELLSTKLIGTTNPNGLTIDTLSSGLLADERTARITADNAEVSARQLLEARVGDAEADILSIQTAYADADSALAQDISDLNAQVNDGVTGLPKAHARITDEETARASADSAQVSRIGAMEARMPSGSGELATTASVTSETNARVSADSALSGRTDVLEARMPAGSGKLATDAQITSLQQAVADGDSANAADITALETRMTDAETDIGVTSSGLSALTTRVDTAEGTITAHGNSLTSLGSRLDTVETDIDGVQSVNAAQAAAISGLDTRVTSAEGSLSSQSNSITSLTNSLATTNTNVATLQQGSGIGTGYTNDPLPTNQKPVRVSLLADVNRSVGTDYLWFKLGHFKLAGNYQAMTITGELAYGSNQRISDVWRIALCVSNQSTPALYFPTLEYSGPGFLDQVFRVYDDIDVDGNHVVSIYARLTSWRSVHLIGDVVIRGNHLNSEFTSYLWSNSVTQMEVGIEPTYTPPGTKITPTANYEIGADVTATSAAHTALTSRVTTAEGTITSQGSAITTLQNDLSALEGDVATKASSAAVSALDSRVTSAEGTLTSQGNAITSLDNRLDTAESDIDGIISTNSAQATAISGLDTRVTSAEGTLSSQGSSITSLSNELTTARGGAGSLDARLDGIDSTVASKASSAALSALDSRVTTAEGGISSNASAITALDGRLDTAEGDISTQGSAISTLQTDLDAVEGTVSSQGSSITSLSNEVTLARNGAASLDARLDGIDTTVGTKASTSALNALTTRVTTAEGNISTQASDISALDTRLDTAEGDISAQGTAISGLDTRLDSAEGSITSQSGQITTLSNEITTARGAAANLDARLDGIDTTVSGKASASALDALTTRVTSVEGVNTSQGNSITSLNNEITTARNGSASLDSRLDGIDSTVSSKASSAALSALDSRVTTAEGTITSQGSSITSLTNEITTARGGSANLDGRLDGIDSAVSSKASASALSALDSRVTTAEGAITSQGSSITSLSNEITTARGGSANLDTRLDGIDTSVNSKASTTALNALTTRVTNVEGVNTSQGNSITALESTVSGHTSDIAARALNSEFQTTKTQVNTNTGAISAQASTLNQVKASLGQDPTNLVKKGTFDDQSVGAWNGGAFITGPHSTVPASGHSYSIVFPNTCYEDWGSFPVSGGEVLDFEGMCYSNATSGDNKPGVHFLKSDGTSAGPGYFPPTTNGAGWHWVRGSLTVPANAASGRSMFARLGTVSGTVMFNSMRITRRTVTENETASALQTLDAQVNSSTDGLATKASSTALTAVSARVGAVEAPNPNLLSNPTGMFNADGWYSAITPTAFETASRSDIGTYFRSLAGGGAAATRTFNFEVDVNMAGAYTLAMDFYRDAGSTGSYYVDALCFNSAGTMLLDSPGSGLLPVGWTRTKETFTAPAGTAKIVVRVVCASSVFSQIIWKRVKLEPGSVATPYSYEAADASVTQIMRADVDAVTGKVNAVYGLNLDVNGYQVGWVFANDGSTGVAKFRTDIFEVSTPSGGDRLEWKSGVMSAIKGSNALKTGAGFGSDTDKLVIYYGPEGTAASRTLADAVFGITASGKPKIGGAWANDIAGWKTGGAVTYSYNTASPAVVTINKASGTLSTSGYEISYNAGSCTVSQARNTTVKYYLYYDDGAGVGGSKTLAASTSPTATYQNPNWIYAGEVTVTVPSAATGGSGSGSGGTCVWEESYVIRRQGAYGVRTQIKFIRVGDYIRVCDPHTGEQRWGLVSRADRALAECVTVNDVLTCSLTAPLGTRKGQVLAPDASGVLLASLLRSKFAYEVGHTVTTAGVLPVMDLTVEDTFYLAGDDPDHMLCHHNIKKDPDL